MYWVKRALYKNSYKHRGFISRFIGLELNAEKTKYVFMSCEQNAGQNHNIMTGN